MRPFNFKFLYAGFLFTILGCFISIYLIGKELKFKLSKLLENIFIVANLILFYYRLNRKWNFDDYYDLKFIKFYLAQFGIFLIIRVLKSNYIIKKYTQILPVFGILVFKVVYVN